MKRRDLPRRIRCPGSAELNSQYPNHSVESFIVKYIGGFNKLLAREVCYRSSLDSNLKFSAISEKEWILLNKNINDIVKEIHTRQASIYFQNKQAVYLSLADLKHLSNDNSYNMKSYDSLNEAWKKFIFNIDKAQTLKKTTKNT